MSGYDNVSNTALITKPFDKDMPNLINPATLQQIESNLNEKPDLTNKISTFTYIYEKYIEPNGIIIFIICILIFAIFIRYYFFADILKDKDLSIDNNSEEDEEEKLRNQFMKNKLYKQYIDHYKNDSLDDDSSVELVGTDDSDSNYNSNYNDRAFFDGVNLDHGRDELLDNENNFRYNMDSFIVDQGFKNRDRIAKEMFR